MAKELPYFKFEPSLWDTGNIQLCTHEAKGMFIDICSMYWQRVGDLPYKLALQKACNGNAVALRQLLDEHIIKVIDGMICIDFLNEQLSGFENISTTNSENARSGWEKRRKNAAALPPQSNPNAIREEKKRVEKKKEEEKIIPLRALPFESLDFTNAWLEWEQYRKEKKQKLTDSTAKKQIQFLGARPEKIAILIINQSITNGWTGLFDLKQQVATKPKMDILTELESIRNHGNS